MNLLKLAIFSLWLFGIPSMAATVYKWVDENGTVHYGQQPKSKSATQMNIKVQPSSSSFEESSEEKPVASNQTGSEDKTAANKSAEELAWEKKQAVIKQKNCKTATDQLASITAGGRLYEMKNGERHYLDDAGRKARLSEARESMNKWCN